MKKVISVLMVILFTVSCFSSCAGYEDPEEIAAMFDSFGKSENYVLLTCFELVIKGERYKRTDIKYKGESTYIVFLDEQGFYSYSYRDTDLCVKFLYTTYDGFKTTELGEAILPAEKIISFYRDNCFWFRMDDPSIEQFRQMYYCWDTVSKTGAAVDRDDVTKNYENSEDNGRTKDYTLDYHSGFFGGSRMEITENSTGTKKVIDRSVLKTFEEGRKIDDANSSTVFTPAQVYIIGDDVYFVSGFGVGFLGDPHYYYIVKWNFYTEECTYITSVYFDYFQEWVDDVIILQE